MFILDSLAISGLRWVLETVRTAADAEREDDGLLRERLLDAELQHEEGAMSAEEFAAVEADLLARIREIREARDGGTGPIALAVGRDAGTNERLTVDASTAGEFHEPEATAPRRRRRPRSRRGS